MRIMRPRRCFRVVLHAEQRQRLMPQPFKRLVVQVNMRQLNFICVNRVGIDSEVVVVCRDLNLPGRVITDRMVAAMVS